MKSGRGELISSCEYILQTSILITILSDS